MLALDFFHWELRFYCQTLNFLNFLVSLTKNECYKCSRIQKISMSNFVLSDHQFPRQLQNAAEVLDFNFLCFSLCVEGCHSMRKLYAMQISRNTDSGRIWHGAMIQEGVTSIHPHSNSNPDPSCWLTFCQFVALLMTNNVVFCFSE